MVDVARHAGVSPQTVSRVSNGLPNVDPTTRQRVVTSMQELGYRPNGAARALKSGRFNTIGVITSGLGTFGAMRTLDAIVREAALAHHAVTLLPVAEPTLGGISGAYDRLGEAAVDGVVIVLQTHLFGDAEFALPPGVPVVVVDSDAGPGFTVVDTDQELGARQATEHLLGLGHRQVWHVAGPATSFAAGRRVRGWRHTLEEAGIEAPEVLHGDWSTDCGYRHGRTLAARPDVTAVFAANDQMALGVIRALHERGRRIPDEVSVVGFDDTEEAASFWPPLTTVRQDFAAVGSLGIRKLLAKIDGTDRHLNDHTLVPTRLIARASSGPVRA